METRLTHAALRTRVQKVRAAAHDGDRARFRWELDRLMAAISEHLAAEASTIAALPAGAARELGEGQQRIRSTLRGLAGDLDAARSIWDFESDVARLDTLLERQDYVERRTFRRAGHEPRSAEMSL